MLQSIWDDLSNMSFLAHPILIIFIFFFVIFPFENFNIIRTNHIF